MSLPHNLQSLDSSQAAAWLGIAIVGLLFFHHIIYPLYISPLSNVPGPKLAAITKLYLNSKYYNETAITWIKSLHDKYGPIVRVGPNEIVINDPKQLSIIYGARSTFPKPPTAVLFENYGAPNSFSSVTREEHKQRRRHVAKVYTMNATLNNAPLLTYIQNRLDKVMSIIDSNPKQPADIYHLSAQFALDNVSFMVYGESLDLLGGQNWQAANDIRAAAIGSTPFVRFPTLIATATSIPLLRNLIPVFLTNAFASGESLMATNQNLIDHVNSKDTKVDPETTALGCLQNQPSFGDSLSEGQVKSECYDHILAGADTTAAAISYAFYVLGQPENRKYQDKIREEVSKLTLPLDFKEVCKLPFLNTFMLEVLRLYAPGPGALQQRVTPSNETTVLITHGKSYKLPPSTMVGIQAYSLHRNDIVFGERPDAFLPERWETTDAARAAAMKEAWIPFGTGARTCLGMNLAIVEFKIITAAFLRKYIIEVPLQTRPESMQPIYAAVIRPKEERCDLLFKRISSSL